MEWVKVKVLKKVAYYGGYHDAGATLSMMDRDVESHVASGLVELAGNVEVVEETTELPTDSSDLLAVLQEKWPLDMEPEEYLVKYPKAKHAKLAQQIVDAKSALTTSLEDKE